MPRVRPGVLAGVEAGVVLAGSQFRGPRPAPPSGVPSAEVRSAGDAAGGDSSTPELQAAGAGPVRGVTGHLQAAGNQDGVTQERRSRASSCSSTAGRCAFREQAQALAM